MLAFFYCLYLFRNDQTVTAVLAGVDHADLLGFGIAEDVELVLEQVHLQDRFLYGHRLYGEGLDADVEFLLLVILLVGNVALERTLAQLLFKTYNFFIAYYSFLDALSRCGKFISCNALPSSSSFANERISSSSCRAYNTRR